MKRLKQAVWLVVALQMILVIYVAASFKVDDMTLVKGEVFDFNTGWTVCREDGRRVEAVSLPYTDTSDAYETVVIENTIPKEFAGLTMRFLTADKQFRVFVDGEEIYQFGMHDVRSFGHTAGSVMNFVDIPQTFGEGHIRMEMTSPYNNYASFINTIEVGKRDRVILRLIASVMPKTARNMIILFTALLSWAGGVLCLINKRDTGGLGCLALFCVVSFLYFSIETKTLIIFYGNQTLYSVLFFLCLMLMPILLQLYIERTLEGFHKKLSELLIFIGVLNALVQMLIQVLNIADFMELSVFSHLLVFIATVSGMVMYIDRLRKDREKSWESILNAAAMVSVCVGTTVDLVRGQIVKVGDLAMCSRIGFTAFGIIMVYIHIMRISKMFAADAENAAMMLQREMTKVEERNQMLVLAREEAEEAKREAQEARDRKSVV